jgi:tetratricopeptide (TPR) repeat protein
VAYREQGKFGEAAAEFTRALELDFSNGRLYLERGVLFQMQGNHERALIDFQAAAARNPKDAEAYFRRGVTLDALGQRQRALTDLSHALRLKPDHAVAFYARGQLYASKSETDLAIGDFSAALHIDPAFTSAYVYRAKALSARGRLDEALGDCEQALANDANLTEAYLVRGSVLAQRGDFARAIDDFSRMLRLEPNHAHAYYLRGVAYLKQDDPRQAVIDLSEAIRLDPNHARAYAQRGAIRQAAGLQELALSDLAHAARLDVQMAPAYCRQLGLIHAAMGQHEWAVADYTLALFLDPNNTAAREGRQRSWQAFQQAPPKRPGSPRTLQEIGRLVPPLKSGPGEPSEPKTVSAVPVLDPRQTGEFRGNVTGSFKVGAETTADLSILDSEDDAQGGDAESTEFELHVSEGDELKRDEPEPKRDEPKPAEDSAEDTSFELNDPEAPTEEHHPLSIDALQDPQPPPEEPVPEEGEPERGEQAGNLGVENEAEQKVREAAEQANRARLVQQFRQAEEERQKKEKEEAKKAKKKAKQRRREEDDDDDDRLPIWKKGALVAAGIFLLYWTGSAALGWFNNPVRTWSARSAVNGKAIMDKGNEPLTGAIVTFHPLTGAAKEVVECSVGQDGSFRTMLFPAEYVVTIGPGKDGVNARTAEAVTRIPGTFKDVKTTPLKITVEGGQKENSFELRVQ